MKTLLLMRHAKSSWDNILLPDFARPLNARGLRAARQMARYLLEQGVTPDLIISSPAERARQTAQLVSATAWPAVPVRHEPAIYEATLNDLLNVMYALPEDCATVLLVGHNPGCAELTAYLVGHEERFPTAAVACIALRVAHWHEARSGGGQLLWLARPKELNL